jgi:hypothetical protein
MTKAKYDWKVGDECVVNELVDTQIYKITKLVGKFAVEMEYTLEGGQVCRSGSQPIDMCYLRKPTKKQLAHSAKKQ